MISHRLPTALAAIIALAPLASAERGDRADAAHRARLATELRQAMNPVQGPDAQTLADRLAGKARSWASDPKTNPSDHDRLKGAVKTMRNLLSAPAATAQTGDFAALAAELEPIIGDASNEVVTKLQRSMFLELVRLFNAAREADSTPANGKPFRYRGRTYGWANFQGKPIIVRWGAPLHRSSGIPHRPDPATPRRDGPGTHFVPYSDGGFTPSRRTTRAASTPRFAPPTGGNSRHPADHHAHAPVPGDVNPQKLDGLRADFREKVIRILQRLQREGWRPKVASGRRTLAEQREILRKGYSKTLRSYHLTGLAADIVDSRWGWGGPAANLNHPFWNALGRAARAEGLTWGGDWKSFKDVAHVQQSR